MDKIYSVYRISNTINNKVYIGMSVSPDKRFRAHKNTAKNPKAKKGYIHKAINAYGVDNFIFEIILQTKTLDNAIFYEIKLIEQYNSFKAGYNLTTGGEGVFGQIFSPERKEAMSKRMTIRNMGNQYWLGKTHTEEHKQYMSDLIKQKYETGEMKRRCGVFKLNPEEQLKLVDDYNSGMIYKQLQKKYNIGANLVATILDNHNIKRTTGKHSKEGMQKIIDSRLKLSYPDGEKAYELYQTGKYSQKELGKMFNVSEDVIGGRFASIKKSMKKI